MLDLKKLVFVTMILFMTACSMDAEQPVFLPFEGDYIGHKIKLIGLEENGKPFDAYLEVNSNSDGSYIATSAIPQKYDDRYSLKAIKRVDDGIIYAFQLNAEPRTLWASRISKRSYEIYPIKISGSGALTVYEFLRNEKTLSVARKFKVKISQTSSSIKLTDNFDRISAQCMVQELIQRNLFKPFAERPKNIITLSGYMPPDTFNNLECKS